MSTFSLADIAQRPEAVAAAVAQDGSARLRLSDGNEYLIQPSRPLRSPLPRVQGVRLDPPIDREGLLALKRPMSDER